MRKSAFVTICLCAVVVSACSHARSGTRGTGDTARAGSTKNTQRVAAAKPRRQSMRPRKKARRTTRKQVEAPKAAGNRGTASSVRSSQGSINRKKFLGNCLDQTGMTTGDCNALYARVGQQNG